MFPNTTSNATVKLSADGAYLQCDGLWTLSGIVPLSSESPTDTVPNQDKLLIDGSTIQRMDSAGAWFLQKCITVWKQHAKEVVLTGFKSEHMSLLAIIDDKLEKLQEPLALPKRHSPLYLLGELTVKKCQHMICFLSFFGELVMMLIASLRTPRSIQWRSLLNTIEETGYSALPIIALLNFLIGVVLTYQMGLQLQIYGANIYIVNVVGMAILREFAPLITAIIVAGRTSSSYTAQIGIMKINEEIDALYTMSLSPIDRLVIPRILGLVIALPLLTAWANAFGIFGSMVMSNNMLDINYSDFFSRFEEVISLQTYFVGMSKTPIFALIISAVGCFQGFRVSSNAESVGHQTTSSVVQAIFLIIIADAIFSIIFSWQGI